MGMEVVMKDGMEVGIKDGLSEGMEAGKKDGMEIARPRMNWPDLCPPVSFLSPSSTATATLSELGYLELLMCFCVYT